jgi:hypothetical protein
MKLLLVTLSNFQMTCQEYLHVVDQSIIKEYSHRYIYAGLNKTNLRYTNLLALKLLPNSKPFGIIYAFLN